MAILYIRGVARHICMYRRGAEADLHEVRWGGRPALLKSRAPKKYRHPDLDARLRRQRTVREAQALARARSLGVRTPLVYAVDSKKCQILMQMARGSTLASSRGARLAGRCREAGAMTAMLHSGGVAHGDLTTSNMLVSRGLLFMIDFGLASFTHRPEDHAVDLRLFKEVLSSAHADDMDSAWRAFVSGYRSSAGPARLREVLRIVAEIEARGRYADVV